jgi:hypothetical protein
MSKRSYNWLTNVALVLGVVSAFLYERTSAPHLLAIAMAVGAGAISISTYLYNQLSCRRTPREDQEVVSLSEDKHSGFDAVAVDAHGKEVVAAEMNMYERHAEMIEAIQLADYQVAITKTFDERIRVLTSLLEAQRRASGARTAAYMQQYLLKNNAARRLRYRFANEKSLMEPEVELSPNEAAACYTQIMREMAGDDKMKYWDFVVDANGLRVSEKKPQEEIYQEEIYQEEIYEVDIELLLHDPGHDLEARQLIDPEISEQRA